MYNASASRLGRFYPNNAATSPVTPSNSGDAAKEKNSWSYEELRAMPLPPCSKEEYHRLKQRYYWDGESAGSIPAMVATSIAIEALEAGKAEIVNWLAARFQPLKFSLSSLGNETPVASRMLLYKWLETADPRCQIELKFILMGFEQPEELNTVIDLVRMDRPLKALRFDMSCNASLRSDELQSLARALKTNRRITEISLSNCELDNSVMYAFGDVLRVNSTLQNFSLQYSSPYTPNSGDRAMVPVDPIAAALRTNTTLTSLCMRNINMEGEIFDALAAAPNTALSSLTLECCDLGPKAGSAIASLLNTNTSLSVLALRENRLAAAMPEIGAALAKNRSLAVLKLRYNRIDCAGAIALADGLKSNQALIKLSLASTRIDTGNNIDMAGAIALANMLAANSSLESLHLHGNRLGGTAGMKMIADAAIVHPSLLDRPGIALSEEAESLAEQHFVENSEKREVDAGHAFRLLPRTDAEQLPLEIGAQIVNVLQKLPNAKPSVSSLKNLYRQVSGIAAPSEARTATVAPAPLTTAEQTQLPETRENIVVDPCKLV